MLHSKHGRSVASVQFFVHRSDMKTYEVASELRRLAHDIENGDIRPLDFGDIIQKLKAIVAKGGEGSYITFDWGCAWPIGFNSYRGDYAQICMEYGGEHRHHQTVKGLLEKMQELLGTTLEGWKGGDYTVDGSKEVYVCCAGCISKTRVVDVLWDGDKYSSARIKTADFIDD